MHAQLELLLELQDLHTQRRALSEEPLKQVEEDVFELQPDEALDLLDTKVEELTERLEPAVRKRYVELCATLDRAVAPVVGGGWRWAFQRLRW